MKSIYFGGTFNLDEDIELSLPDRLRNDYRARLLGNPNRMVNYYSNVILSLGENINCRYIGPFYCEEAVAGDFTSTNCEVVVRREREQVEECDLVVCVFDKWLSIGTTVELEWAVELGKDILIFYEEEESEYSLPSGLWFVIQDAIQRGRNVKTHGYKDFNSEYSILISILLDYCKNGCLYNNLKKKKEFIEYLPTPVDTSDMILSKELVSLTNEIARNVHEVWAEGRINQGWKYGESRDDSLMTHPCLVPYDELSESEKNFDRSTAIETLKLITKLGFKITKD